MFHARQDYRPLVGWGACLGASAAFRISVPNVGCSALRYGSVMYHPRVARSCGFNDFMAGRGLAQVWICDFALLGSRVKRLLAAHRPADRSPAGKPDGATPRRSPNGQPTYRGSGRQE